MLLFTDTPLYWILVSVQLVTVQMPSMPRDQSIHIVPSFTLESGVVLKNAEVAYKTWGELNATKDNVMVFCHGANVSNDLEFEE